MGAAFSSPPPLIQIPGPGCQIQVPAGSFYEINHRRGRPPVYHRSSYLRSRPKPHHTHRSNFSESDFSESTGSDRYMERGRNKHNGYHGGGRWDQRFEEGGTRGPMPREESPNLDEHMGRFPAARMNMPGPMVGAGRMGPMAGHIGQMPHMNGMPMGMPLPDMGGPLPAAMNPAMRMDGAPGVGMGARGDNRCPVAPRAGEANARYPGFMSHAYPADQQGIPASPIPADGRVLQAQPSPGARRAAQVRHSPDGVHNVIRGAYEFPQGSPSVSSRRRRPSLDRESTVSKEKSKDQATCCPHPSCHAHPTLDSLDACLCSNTCTCKRGNRVIYYNHKQNGDPERGEIRFVLKDDVGKNCGDHGDCYTKSGKKKSKLTSDEQILEKLERLERTAAGMGQAGVVGDAVAASPFRQHQPLPQMPLLQPQQAPAGPQARPMNNMDVGMMNPWVNNYPDTEPSVGNFPVDMMDNMGPPPIRHMGRGMQMQPDMAQRGHPGRGRRGGHLHPGVVRGGGVFGRAPPFSMGFMNGGGRRGRGGFTVPGARRRRPEFPVDNNFGRAGGGHGDGDWGDFRMMGMGDEDEEWEDEDGDMFGERTGSAARGEKETWPGQCASPPRRRGGNGVSGAGRHNFGSVGRGRSGRGRQAHVEDENEEE